MLAVSVSFRDSLMVLGAPSHPADSDEGVAARVVGSGIGEDQESGAK